jgi:mRNA-degrading endonuclease toxin of MazEF toxin-antitoxin module
VSRPARGDVWWDETLTHGRRPYIVLTRDEAIEQLGEVIVVPLTTTVRRLPNEVELDESDGTPRACVTSLDNLSTIAKGQLVEKITVVGTAKMDELCRALDATVACASI